ncbi:MAG: Aspartate aminotransferase [candidate division BRC1 bacterium ADurb.BinA292]|nr:MAG: Aspartate aminotransferase [candidate division BRC1 bacterium ADurb.BinA292]
MLETLPMAPADPILGLTEAFKKDPNPNKINLGVGIYVDDEGLSPLFRTVHKAEEKLWRGAQPKAYLPISGSVEYGRAVQKLIFSADSPLIADKRLRTAQTPGGTGALRVAGDFLHTRFPKARIWFSNPTWNNHFNVFEAAGLEILEYPYFDPATHTLDWDGLLAGLRAIPAGDVVLLHGCCHNPTGVDPSPAQWDEIGRVLAEHNLFPLVDLAYQGFGDGVDEDAEGIRILARHLPEMLICSSFSKNFGLYNERVGALTVVAESDDAAERAFSHVKAVIRANYSNPPAHGALIVKTILAEDDLRAEWEAELVVIRGRVQQMRELFAATMKQKGVEQDFSFMIDQKGMFSLSGLSREQVDWLKREKAVYMVGSGRVNVAGMTARNMNALCDAVAEVLATVNVG